ncbi:MAG: crossover junction endodeoxyribonuclease RuvC [Holosporales bacterium]|jgi:crossover junction endodeoxyribonuclease RuvC|nr:crossover junction endodeoxyribonuclease RuvC [Holosporales bacterium]
MKNLGNNVLLGIDPGLVQTGWGVISLTGSEVNFIDCGIIRTNSSEKLESRLITIFNRVNEIVTTYRPSRAAIEEVFVNSNPKTSEKLIMARTSAYLALSIAGLQTSEYKPNAVKKNITGSGHAEKRQVWIMVRQILRLDYDSGGGRSVPSDATDALAIALCLAFSGY